MNRLVAFYAKHWFSLTLLACVALAWALPQPATFVRDYHILQAMIAVVFLNSGLTIRSRQMLAGLTDAKSFLTVQALSFVAFPVLMGFSARWLFAGQEADLSLGYGLLLAVPTTISSCVVMTTIAGGATAVALVCAVGGNLLGVVVSPWLLKLYAGVAADIDAWAMVVKLSQMVLAPVVVGQIIRRFAPDFFSARSKILSKFNQCVILLIVYTSATRAIPVLSGAPSMLLTTAVYLAVFHVAMLGLSTGAAKLRGGDPSLAPAIILCGSQKTLAIGQALAMSVGAQTGANDGLLMVPMVLYHVIQLLIDAILAQRMSKQTLRQ